MSTKGDPVFTFSLPKGAARPFAPRQLLHWALYCTLLEIRTYQENFQNEENQKLRWNHEKQGSLPSNTKSCCLSVFAR